MRQRKANGTSKLFSAEKPDRFVAIKSAGSTVYPSDIAAEQTDFLALSVSVTQAVGVKLC
jgi:hypothetical protein